MDLAGFTVLPMGKTSGRPLGTRPRAALSSTATYRAVVINRVLADLLGDPERADMLIDDDARTLVIVPKRHAGRRATRIQAGRRRISCSAVFARLDLPERFHAEVPVRVEDGMAVLDLSGVGARV